jgi:hypothetical protein
MRKPGISSASLLALSWKLKPEAEEAFLLVSRPKGWGSKMRPSQEPSAGPFAWLWTAPGCCQESALAVKESGPSQVVGRVS